MEDWEHLSTEQLQKDKKVFMSPSQKDGLRPGAAFSGFINGLLCDLNLVA